MIQVTHRRPIASVMACLAVLVTLPGCGSDSTQADSMAGESVAQPTSSPQPSVQPTSAPELIGLTLLELEIADQRFLLDLSDSRDEYVLEIGAHHVGELEITGVAVKSGNRVDVATGDRFDPNNPMRIQVWNEDLSASRDYLITFERDTGRNELIASAVASSCENFASFALGPYLLENNAWNAAEITDEFEQCVYVNASGMKPVMGWVWDFPDQASEEVLSFPEIIFGWKPFLAESTTDELPMALDEIEFLRAAFDFETYFDGGGFNLAFDLWLIDGDLASPGRIRYEVMIWEYRAAGLQPFGTQVATLQAPSGTYDVYAGEPDWEPEGADWTYIALVRDQPRFDGEVNIGFLLAALRDANLLPDSLTLSSVSLGNEIGASRGYTLVHELDVEIGRHD